MVTVGGQVIVTWAWGRMTASVSRQRAPIQPRDCLMDKLRGDTPALRYSVFMFDPVDA
jgi:hypothetical protein